MTPSLPASEPRRVLVVERSDDLRDFLSMVLASAGCDVLQSPDALSAAALIAGARPGLVLVEAEPSPLALLAQLEGLTPPPAVVAMLASQAGLDWPHGHASQVAAVLVKPFGVRQLLETCGRALEAGLPLPERRRAVRQPRAGQIEVYARGGRLLRGDVLDLSPSGARVRFAEPLEGGGLHHFALCPQGGAVSRAMGAVAWQTWSDDAWVLGLEFAPLPGGGPGGLAQLLSEPPS